MGVSSAMYAAVTGMQALSTGMQTISNNIANVNTVGFKAGRTNYEDLISQSYFSGNGVNQVGSGVKVSTIQTMFTQGSFMTSAQDTDMAIAGDGFFSVRNTVTGAINYTRAGVFTLNNEGYMEDPSGNILQGWQMSVPKPGQSAVKIGTTTDIKITVLNAPPVETSQIKVAVNLNAADDPAYLYEANQLSVDYADSIAVPAAKAASEAAANAVWSASCTAAAFDSSASTVTPGQDSAGTPSAQYAACFLEAYNNKYGIYYNVADPLNAFNALATNIVTANPDYSQGQLTAEEFNTLATVADANMHALAAQAGKSAYSSVYSSVYQANESIITSQLSQWILEGNGFAGAWDGGSETPIDDSSYTHSVPMTIYDSLGAAHTLMIYYQKNPHMENVWDYIITCDPLEDARKDSNNSLLFSDGASFSGLIQKGKITFSADGDDRHGGVIKDIEAQNLDMSKCKMASSDAPSVAAGSTATIQNAAIGGYFEGSPTINPVTGVYETSSRTYTLTWSGNVQTDPLTSGFIWADDAGNTGIIRIYERNTAGPYEFGSGMTITFNTQDTPLNFSAGDSLSVTAHSEQIAWSNATPNADGYFDFDVAFVQSASMALHPPYPAGMPTVTQNIAFDMGAKNPYGLSTTWVLDSVGTTQYATKSSTTFSSQDGYPSGSLQRVSIGEDGVITGIYSNGRQQALYQVALTTFLNPWGLSKVGDNLYAATNYSGEGTTNEAGYGGAGTILANFLEQSNVDLSEEIVNMIITQRGFQANSKVITTTDSMLEEVIAMKR